MLGPINGGDYVQENTYRIDRRRRRTWVYKDRIPSSTDDVTRNVRERIAAALDAAAEAVGIANIVERDYTRWQGD